MTTIEAIKKLYAIAPDDLYGYSETQISLVEKRLTVCFPMPLRTYYLTLATHERLNQSHNRLISLDELHFEGDYLILYEENQQVCFWAIKKSELQQSNPPVYVGYSLADSDELNWVLSHQNLDDFFLEMAFYNGTMGGLRYNANMLNQPNQKAVQTIQTDKTEIRALRTPNQRFYTDAYHEAISLCFDDEGQCTAVFVGTEDEERFAELLELFGYEDWSYTSYDDEDWEEDEENE